MLGRGAVDIEVGQVQVQQVTAPQQRVERVVRGICGKGEVTDQRAGAHRGEADPRPRPGATPRSRASGTVPGLCRVSIAVTTLWDTA